MSWNRIDIMMGLLEKVHAYFLSIPSTIFIGQNLQLYHFFNTFQHETIIMVQISQLHLTPLLMQNICLYIVTKLTNSTEIRILKKNQDTKKM
jgi:hypothetical protein